MSSAASKYSFAIVRPERLNPSLLTTEAPTVQSSLSSTRATCFCLLFLKPSDEFSLEALLMTCSLPWEELDCLARLRFPFPAVTPVVAVVPNSWSCSSLYCCSVSSPRSL
uniref:Uncharacterized protein n=1 Tax=Arundo donax TaxID=35708 RepID=A0A0A9EDZ0_ARUDO